LCESGGIGRRTRLRIWRVKPWGFESPLSHQQLSIVRDSALYWLCPISCPLVFARPPRAIRVRMNTSHPDSAKRACAVCRRSLGLEALHLRCLECGCADLSLSPFRCPVRATDGNTMALCRGHMASRYLPSKTSVISADSPDLSVRVISIRTYLSPQVMKIALASKLTSALTLLLMTHVPLSFVSSPRTA
jgi:hypothetical protein